MALNRFEERLDHEVAELRDAGTTKGGELVCVGVIKPSDGHGPRFLLDGYADKQFIRMNANSYLGMAFRSDMLKAEEQGARQFGVGPGSVRFISGSYQPHIELEKRLAAFHGREDCMITSSAYTSMLGVVSTLTTPETIIISDELNHNCIINAKRLARPQAKKIFSHLDMTALENEIKQSVGQCDNLIVITDGVFSMRGDYAPLDEISTICKNYNEQFSRDIVLAVDDSHGVGALGKTGRGTEELTSANGIDILVATLGKAFGVNGGYIVTSKKVVSYLREKNPFYVYTNPITPSEATAALKALDILESAEGGALLSHLREMTVRFERGLTNLGFETIPSEHPVVPLMVRDTKKTSDMVAYLRENGVLATGLNFPVVPKGDQLIRFQINADHTAGDIDFVLNILEKHEYSSR
ncbi:MAG: aminotransferase class I/II-fold pyridoxal phosphate-dependent enzyme [Candidatus Zixiibacteriota bacterium]